MKRGTACLVVSGLLFVGMVQAAWAAEQGTASPSARPVSTTATRSKSKEVEGAITMLDLKSALPTMRLTGVGGQAWTFALDPKSTSVWKEGRMITLDELREGQSVRIRHTTMGGKDLAQSIRMIPASKPVASAAKPKTKTY